MTATAIISGLQQLGYERYDLASALGVSATDAGLRGLTTEFEELPPDPYAPEDGRFRRFGRGVLLPWNGAFHWMPDTAAADGSQDDGVTLYQQGAYNPEYLGLVRRIPGLTEGVRRNSLLAEMVSFDFSQTTWNNAELCSPIVVGVHLIKLAVTGPGGRAVASPNMLHQDGEPYTFAHLIYRRNVAGGENVIATPHCAGSVPEDVAPENLLDRFTISNPLDSYAVKDDMVSHYVAPITADSGSGPAERAILLIDFTPMVPRT
ncbi:2OG-Fe dioxygenase family protein [Amycolatopsis pigmentata]|uniref:2OG-Fe dioxygenase family protein n=1 Tax=Amycolatopsis pigmentata TaxID=450801 RepID=A0ABW5FRR9_9PSEU